jgi:hypothetical protein
MSRARVGAEVLADVLSRAGVDTTFGLPGTSMRPAGWAPAEGQGAAGRHSPSPAAKIGRAAARWVG